MSEKLFGVFYTDNEGNDSIESYASEEAANAAIAEELEQVKEELRSDGWEYDCGDFGTRTDIWTPGNDKYASWERMWL